MKVNVKKMFLSLGVALGLSTLLHIMGEHSLLIHGAVGFLTGIFIPWIEVKGDQESSK